MNSKKIVKIFYQNNACLQVFLSQHTHSSAVLKLK
ncbi:hypothetical protein NEOC65_000939 [Neochlamydia sp. AcF65]|nr:hypothetical protein [Neochlamydia sp. AcF65]